MARVEVPIPNEVNYTERSLIGFVETISKYKDSIANLYFPLGHLDTDKDVWGIRAPSFVYNRTGEPNRDLIIAWERAIEAIFGHTECRAKILLNNMYSDLFHSVEGQELILRKLNFYRKTLDIQSVTIVDLVMYPVLRNAGYEVSLSTNSHNSLSELDMILDLFGDIESVVIQRDQNRNPKRLLSFLDKRGILNKAVLMVNEGCINACPFKIVGDIEIGLSDVKTKSNVVHTTGCGSLVRNQPWTFLTSQFLTKPMLDKYYPTIERIKLAGRNLSTSFVKHALDHWVNGTKYELKDILNVFIPNSSISTDDLTSSYTSTVMSCNKECSTCRKCEAFFNTLTKEQK